VPEHRRRSDEGHAEVPAGISGVVIGGADVGEALASSDSCR
jgi:hypothetical protein